MTKTSCKKCNGTGKRLPTLSATGKDQFKVELQECSHCAGTGKLAGKASLVDEINSHRVKYGMKPLSKVECDELKLTRSKLDQLLHQYQVAATPSAPINITTASLLKRLNVTLIKQDKQPLKSWKKSREALVTAVQKAEADRTNVPTTKLKPAIANGATLDKFKTQLHTNHVEKAVKRRDKQLAKSKFTDQQALADEVVKRTRQKRSIVLGWIVARDFVTTKDLPKDFGATLEAYITSKESLRAEARKHPQPKSGTVKPVSKKREPRPASGTHKPRVSAGLNPAALAELTGRDARAIRVTLRRIENDIPKAWRIADERWGFKKEHEADILKMLKP